mmetsp:Transcript_21342/g.61722  ORF Transcript_21342/g.61722 Transcript_21342/m.61722 type:complete len:192 (-) Transcript_21342:62-637(-)
MGRPGAPPRHPGPPLALLLLAWLPGAVALLDHPRTQVSIGVEQAAVLAGNLSALAQSGLNEMRAQAVNATVLGNSNCGSNDMELLAGQEVWSAMGPCTKKGFSLAPLELKVPVFAKCLFETVGLTESCGTCMAYPIDVGIRKMCLSCTSDLCSPDCMKCSAGGLTQCEECSGFASGTMAKDCKKKKRGGMH